MKMPENPFLKIGELLTERLQIGCRKEQNQGIAGELNTLSGGNAAEVKKYFAHKIADTLLVLTVMALVSLTVFLTVDRSSRIVENNELQRPGYGMGDREEDLTVQVDGIEEERPLSVTVQEKRYTAQQAEELLEQGKETLEKELVGENVSLDEVRTRLNFPESLADGAVSVEWMTIPYGIIDDSGAIIGESEENGTIVEIQATLSCQGKELIYETAACVYPPLLSEEEEIWQSVQREVKQADEAEAERSVLTLPEQIAGRNITWLRQPQELLPLFLLLTLFLPCFVWIRRDQQIHQKIRARNLQLGADYSELLWKMTMLLGAGLTIHSAFVKIAAEYQKDRDTNIRYVYEEMVSACIEMKSGVAEGAAYENFGRRCGLPGYIKLGSLLAQNLKKGSKGLASILEKEAETSMEERKNMARKLGEQAGTRLLFPMILMFGVVLVILIVPAFLSM
ncbi:MAG: type II secretion system F family protein [Lachnospiraceae bacterium]|nr:type II secretion system F family protein [Lachnospiraceae bacterium]